MTTWKRIQRGCSKCFLYLQKVAQSHWGMMSFRGCCVPYVITTLVPLQHPQTREKDPPSFFVRTSLSFMTWDPSPSSASSLTIDPPDQRVRGELPSYINALSQTSWWKTLAAHLALLPVISQWVHPWRPRARAIQQPRTPVCPLKVFHPPTHLRDGTQCPQNQRGIVLICLRWSCSELPSMPRYGHRFQPSILIYQVWWLSVPHCNRWYVTLHASQGECEAWQHPIQFNPSNEPW